MDGTRSNAASRILQAFQSRARPICFRLYKRRSRWRESKAGELNKRVGKEPAALIDLHIADLLPSDPKPNRKDTSAYRLTDKDVKGLTNTISEDHKGKYGKADNVGFMGRTLSEKDSARAIQSPIQLSFMV